MLVFLCRRGILGFSSLPGGEINKKLALILYEFVVALHSTIVLYLVLQSTPAHVNKWAGYSAIAPSL